MPPLAASRFAAPNAGIPLSFGGTGDMAFVISFDGITTRLEVAQMRRLLAGVVCASLAATLGAAGPEPEIKWEFREPKSAQFKRLWKEARDDKDKGLETFSAVFSKLLVFPRTLTIAAEECGAKGTFYSAKDSRVTLCYEVLKDLEDRARKRYPKAVERGLADQLSGGVGAFLLFHELGHALIDMFDLKSGGREEDVADQIATQMLVTSAQGEVILPAVTWYFEQSESVVNDDALADEHSLDRQRLYNVLCWAYGSDTEKYAHLAEEIQELRGRASRCKNEYAKLSKWFEEAMKPHLDPEGIAELQRLGGGGATPAPQPATPTPSPATPAPANVTQFEVAQGGFYAHPKYPAYIFTLTGAIVSMTSPYPGDQPSSWNALALPESQWVPLIDNLGRPVPVMLMRSGEHLFAQWMP